MKVSSHEGAARARFVTGASGGIGSAVVSELLTAGHQVVGLARSEAAAATLDRPGAAPLHGDIPDPGRLRRVSPGAGGVFVVGESRGVRGGG
ncbi:SDR family NAD(P)-dependent oxidoreductase, partial [Mycobacterium tilburgii]|uniref:SDR family NAD(P)-dependent oxidoreductase n=1 Tax=Mycobacterium tilburgii TaxID=44467 RepID=UPI0011828AE7